jgi:putative tricarboxylic transport membrane protein
MKVRDQLSGLFWLALSVFVSVKSVKMGVGTFHLPGPGFLPFWAGVIFGTLSLVLIIKGSFHKKPSKEKVKQEGELRYSKVAFVLISLLIYVLFLQRVGYLPMTFGLMLCLFIIAEKSKWWIKIVSALATSLLTYVIFYSWLGVELPKGIVDF